MAAGSFKDARVHLGCDGIARGSSAAIRGNMNMLVGLGGSHGLLAAERQDNGYAVVDVGDCFVCLGREDGEVDRG
jgi:hypothetical protein